MTLTVTSLALVTAIANPLQAATTGTKVVIPSSQVALTDDSNPMNQSGVIQAQKWLMADKGDKDDKKRYKRDRDDDDDYEKVRIVRVDLNRAKNLARQAAETANGGLRYYRAEASMHGSAQECPYVDNGDSWTFTFLGSRPGSSVMTTESVVTVYKASPRVVVAYNGTLRRVQQTQITSFSSNQRTVLVDLLRGNCGCNYLLTNAVRTEIISQARSLPPGIQKRLLKGKGLPPGIAKKWVVLPKQVNTYINLPTYYDLVVIGTNVVLVNQTNSVVVDWIANVL
jgi:hypothetical protein